MKKVSILGALTLLLVSLSLAPATISEHDSLLLQAPSFAISAYGQEDDGVDFLASEAGIAAYVDFGQEINIDEIRSAFKSEESVSDSYIIGEVALEGFPEEVHPHLYVNSDGWIVAYYSKHEPSSKIVQ